MSAPTMTSSHGSRPHQGGALRCAWWWYHQPPVVGAQLAVILRESDGCAGAPTWGLLPGATVPGTALPASQGCTAVHARALLALCCWPRCCLGLSCACTHAYIVICCHAYLPMGEVGGRCPQPPQQLPLGPAGASVRAGHQAATSPRTCWGCAQTDLRPRVPQQPRPGTAGRTTQLRVVSGNHDVISGPPILACYSDEWCYGDGASSAAGTTTAVGARGRAIAWHCAQ